MSSFISSERLVLLLFEMVLFYLWLCVNILLLALTLFKSTLYMVFRCLDWPEVNESLHFLSDLHMEHFTPHFDWGKYLQSGDSTMLYIYSLQSLFSNFSIP